MRHVRLLVLVLLAGILLTGSAFADSVSMTLLSVGGNSGGGEYTYPYNFSINGGASTPLLCNTFDNTVIVGETWTANVSSLLSGTGLFGNQPLKYGAAGLIFNDILAGKIDATVGNWAIWGLFSTTAAANSYFTSSGAAALDAKYLAMVPNASPSAFAGLVLYSPIAGTQSWGGTPQEYIGRVSVPEPAEISMLIALGLFSVGVLVFGKRFGLKPAIQLSR